MLLFKSGRLNDQARDKDLQDFESAYVLLELERRAWLRWALAVVSLAHTWIELLK